MSIDSLIEDKKDAMQLGGQPLNPSVGPDLIEVLATRKLLEEKAMIARDLALKQQPIPNTIAEQQDQKLLGLTQKEIANQTGGILANRAQQQGKPQPRPQQGGIMGAPKPPMGGAPRPPMGGAPRPPMGGAPRPPMGGAPMGGLPNAAPRPPMMASGGIVGFDVGGLVSAAEREVSKLGLVDDPTSPDYQAKLQNIMDTLTAQSNPEEKSAVKQVLEDAGLKTGAAKAKYDVNRARGSQFGGGMGSPRYGEQVQSQVDERGAMAIVDQAMALSGAQGLKTIIAGAGKKYGPQAVNYAKKKLASMGDSAGKLKNPARKLVTESRHRRQFPDAKVGKTSTGRMTKKGSADEVRDLSAKRVGETVGVGSLGYLGLDAMAGGDDAAAAQADQDRQVSNIRNDIKTAEEMLQAKIPTSTGTGTGTGTGKGTGTGTETKTPTDTIGTGKEFDLSVDPSEFSSTSVSDNMNPLVKKQLDKNLAIDPKAAGEEEREAAMGRYKVDETTSGLQDILDRQLAESKRVATDPQLQYRRNKASIYAAQGAKGRAYQQRELDRQAMPSKLLQQEASNFATMANTEAALMSKVDAEAGKAATLAATMLNNSMQVMATYDVADREAFREMIAQRGQQLKDEAALKLKREHNIALNEIQTMQQITAASNAMSSIIAAEITQLQSSAAYMAAGSEERLDMEKKLNMEQNIKYIYPQQELIKRISKGFNIDLGDSGDSGDSGVSGGSEVDLTDEEAAAMAL